jgi:hypothetical protein
MIRLSPDRYAPIVPDAWTEDATIQPATLHTMGGIEHRLPGLRVSLWEVTDLSPDSAFEAAALYARYFQREVHTDDVPYSVRRGLRRTDENTRLWLWTIPPVTTPGFRVIGAAACVYNAMLSTPAFWELRFVWIFPAYRNRHAFSAAWPILLARCQFLRIAPLTLTMRWFLHGKPTWPVATAQGETVHLLSDRPGCLHGPMHQISPTLWRCGAELPDGTYCQASYQTPAAARRARS